MSVPVKQLATVPFAQKSELTVLLENLVRSYPKGVGIVHEFIQNADDAGATRVWVLLDERQHGTAQLPGLRMARLQGPAVVVFNDAAFSDDDWRRIQSTGKSGKALDASKTGRFGLGFNSVYNVTDWPGVLTQDRLGFFDPHGTVVEGATRDKPGEAWILNKNLWEECADLLAVFEHFGLEEGSKHFDGTAFRLPLRDHEAAQDSEICQQPFTRDNFDALVKKLIKEAGEVLLFLKHLLELRISHISPGGAVRDIVTIRTENVEEIISARSQVHGQLSSDHAEVLTLVEESDPESLIVEYDHNVVIDCPGKKVVEQTWSVVQGLISGEDDELVDAARRMNDYEEKAVPLVGAAALINSTAKTSQTDGRLFCTLPLASVSSFLPFHINGFFDLQSDRQGVFSDTGAEGKDAVRVEWNTALIKHGCADVAARLIARIGEQGPRTTSFYDFWPEVPHTTHTLMQSLPAEVYEQLHHYDCIGCSLDKRLMLPNDVRLLPQKEWQVRKALLADDLPIPRPSLPQHVVDGFNTTSQVLQVMSPEDVRDELRDSEDPDCPLVEAERQSLQKKEWIVALANYCCSDSNLDDLSGVPLALTADGQLHAFDTRDGGPVYIGGRRERELLSSSASLFLDEDIQMTPQLAPNSHVGIEEMTPTELVGKLPDVLVDLGDDVSVVWNPKAEGIPKDVWLTELYAYLADNGEDCTLDSDVVETLPLVPDQFGYLWAMGQTSTPLLPAGTRVQSRLIEALKPFHVPVVDGSPSLMKEIRRFEEAYKDQAIWRISGRDLVDTLSAVNSDWEESVGKFSEDIHGVLLGFLSTAEAIRSIKDASPSRKDTLRALPVFPMRDGKLVSLETANVYLPAGFDLPSIDADLGFLNPGASNAWLPLFKALDVPQLTRARLIREILLPRYGDLAQPDQLHVLQWLRTHLEEACDELNDTEEAALRNELESIPLVVCTDGQLREGKALYEPGAESVVGSLLGDIVGFPDMTVYREHKSRWLRLFKQLGMEVQPRPEDLLAAVDVAVEAVSTDRRDSVVALERIARYLGEHWTDVRDMEVRDDNSDTDANAWTMVDALSCREWLPALQEAPRGFPRELFEAPESTLYSPKDLFARDALDLVSLVGPVSELDFGRMGMGNDIGLTHHVEGPLLIEQLDQVVAVASDATRGFKLGHRTAQLLRNIYRQLGQFYPPLSETTEEFQNVRETFADKPCIIDEGGILWKPANTFAEAVPYFSGRRAHVRSKYPDTDRGIAVLGRQDAPSALDFKRFFEEVEAEQGEEAVEDDMTESLRLAYCRAATVEDSDDVLRSAMVLTDGGFLVEPDGVVIDDAEWLSERARRAGLAILDSELNVQVAEAFGVQSLSRAVFERPCRKRKCTDSGLETTCQGLETVINSPEFLQGIRRLIRSNQVTERLEDLEWLNDLQLEGADVLVSELVWQDANQAIDNSEGESDVLFDPDNNLIVVSRIAGDVLYERVASVIAHELGMEGYPVDTLALAAVLRKTPSQIGDVLTRLRIPQLLKETQVDDEQAPEDGGFIDEADVDNEPVDEEVVEEGSTESGDDADDDGHENSDAGVESSGKKSPQGKPEPTKSSACDSGASRPGDATGHDRGADGLGSEDADDDAHVEDGDDDDASITDDVYSTGRSRRPDGKPSSSPGSRPPRSQQSRSRSGSTQNRRAVTYAAPKTDDSDREDPGKREHRSRVDQAAIDLVLRYEEDNGRNAESMPPMNPGYDVESFNEDGGLERYIEVKGLSGAWTDFGAGVSPRQIEKCHKEGDAFWLYVVEFALEPARARIYAIRNPVSVIDEYRFDGGWKALATENSGAVTAPRPGLRVVVENNREGVIESVDERGALKRLHVLFVDGTKKDVVYTPARVKVLPPEEAN